MLFCDSCGSLKRAHREGRTVEHRCSQCDRGNDVPPGGSRPGRTIPNAHERDERMEPTGAYELRFDRADKLDKHTRDEQMRPATAPTRRRVQFEPTGAPNTRYEPPPRSERDPKAGPFFPFASMRPGQAKFISDVRGTLTNGKVLVAQVPTGLGKTAGVLAPALEVARRTNSRIFFLTPKQSQHRVVIETLKMAEAAANTQIVVSDMIAKKAMCPRPESEQLNAKAFGEFCSTAMIKGTCEYYENDEGEAVRRLASSIHHVEDAVTMCADSEHVCPYKALNEVAVVANVVVMDYNHFFSDLLPSTLERLRIKLDDAILVIDEAHNLPDRIRDHLSKELTVHLVSDAISECRRHNAYPLSRWLEEIDSYLGRLEQREEEQALEPEHLLAPLEEMLARAFPLQQPSLHEALDELRAVGEKELKKEAQSAALLIVEFLEAWSPSPKVDERAVLRMWSPDARGIVHKVLDAAVLARPIFEKVRGAVLMSGTMFPMEMYGAILGVPKDRARYELYPNPFPPENRRIVVDAGVTTQMKARGYDTFQNIAKGIADVCERTPGNVAAFFPSYNLLDEIRHCLPETRRAIVVEERGGDKAEKERLVDQVRAADGSALLLGVQGGSLSEGYDFVEDDSNLLASVLVIGIPYAVPTLEVKTLQAFFDQKFGQGKGWLYGYLAPALQRVLQAAGRGIRAEHHRAFIGLLDKRLLQRNVQRWMPPDVKAMASHDIGEDAGQFFGTEAKRSFRF